MAKNSVPEEKTGQKVQTKYDRKVEKRQAQKAKDKKQQKAVRLTAVIIVAILVIAAAGSAGYSFGKKQKALNGTYIEVGEHKISQVEYDYYYYSAVSSYMMSYGSLLPYMGLDTSVPYDQQMFSDTLTWKDMFDQMTAEQIKQTKGLLDDAKKAGFTYDTDADYNSFVEGVESAAEEEGISASSYYKQVFGEYATKSSLEPYVRDGILANNYYSKLIEDNAPTEDEIKAYYEENVLSYDKVDYRSFTFTAETQEDATEEEAAKAYEELKKKAAAMLEAYQAGGDFEELCAENASEEAKETYEDPDTEYSLSEGRNYSGIPTVMAEWLYDEARAANDMAVLEDEENGRCYVVEFISRYYDEADDENISNTISSERVSEYIMELAESYELKDPDGRLKYLTAEETEGTDEAPAGEETDTASDEAETKEQE